MTTLHLSQKLLTLRKTQKRLVSIKSFGSILHIDLVSKQNVRRIFLQLIK